MSTLLSSVPPETFLVASIWTASRSFFDANEQVSHTVSLYSKSGRTYAKYIFKDLKKAYPSPGFSEMLTMCSSQLQVFEKVSLRCLCEGVSSIITPSIEIGGWKTGSLFREINIDNVLLGLKVTS